MKNRKSGMRSKGQPQKILSGRRIPLPEEFMEKHNIHEGDIVLLQEEKGKLSVVPANVTPK